MKKHLFDLTPSDFEAYPVWRNDLSDEEADGELAYIPVKKLPAESLKHRVIGVRVTLANGVKIWSRISHIRLSDARYTQHHLAFSVEKDGKWFALRRYFDPGYEKASPKALAEFLGMDVNDVFPITYDLNPYVIEGSPAAIGVISKEPQETLSQEELRGLRARPPIEGSEEEQEWRRFLRHLEAEKPELQNRKSIETIKARLAEKEERDRRKHGQEKGDK